MNIHVLKNVFAGDIGNKPIAAKPVAGSPFSQNEPAVEPLKNFDHTLDNKIKAETPTETSPAKKKKDQNTESSPQETNPANSSTEQEIRPQPGLADEVAAAKIQALAQQQIKNQTQDKTDLPVTGSKNFGQIISEIAKSTNKPVNPTMGQQQSQVKPEIIVPDIARARIIENASDTAKEKVAVISESVVATDANLPETKADIPLIPSKVISDPQGSEEPAPKIIITESKEQAHVPEKPPVTENPKPRSANMPFIANDEKPVDPKPDLVIKPQITPQTSEQITQVNSSQPDQIDNNVVKPELFELPEKNTAEPHAPPTNPITQKIGPAHVKPSPQQVENHGDSLTDQNLDSDAELGRQVFSGENGQAPVAEPSPTPDVPFAKTAADAEPAEPISQQIQESVISSVHQGRNHIVVQLNPPELGKVTIKFAEQGDEISGSLQVDKNETKNQIQQTLPEIIQNLSDSGIRIRKLEIVLTNQQEQYSAKDQSTAGQNSFSHHQNSPDHHSPINTSGYNEWLTNPDIAPEFTQPGMQITNSSINMLV